MGIVYIYKEIMNNFILSAEFHSENMNCTHVFSFQYGFRFVSAFNGVARADKILKIMTNREIHRRFYLQTLKQFNIHSPFNIIELFRFKKRVGQLDPFINISVAADVV